MTSVRTLESALVHDVRKFDALMIAGNDLIILTSWMAAEGYTSDNIAEAVRKPWHWADELEQAKADLTGRA